jgi:chromosome segregation ATPase
MSEELREQFEQSIADMPVVTIEAVSKLRERAMKMEAGNKIQDAEITELRKELEETYNRCVSWAESKGAVLRMYEDSQAKIEQLNAEIAELKELRERYFDAESAAKEIEQLNAKVAMMSEALIAYRKAGVFNSTDFNLQSVAYNLGLLALEATEADVQRFINGVKADALQEMYDGRYVDFPVLLSKIKELRGE